MKHSEWLAESARLFEIKRRYLLILKEVKQEREAGIHYTVRINADGMSQYRLLDENERQLSPEFGTSMEAWLWYLEAKQK